jgi:capsular polysaccharide biosynthesis protein
MRTPWWSALLAATAIGAGIGAAVAAAGHTEYQAEAKVVVQAQGGPAAVRPLLPNVRELATSSILAGNVDSTLRLPGSPDELRKRLDASIAAGSQVIVVSVTDRRQDRARQIAQEAAVVLTQLIQARLRTPPLNATVLDPAHVVSHHGRHFLRDALVGGAIGLALAGAALLTTRRGLIAVSPPTDEKLAERERQLKERVELVTKRERETAKRAGELAKRERAVHGREEEARRREAAPPKPAVPAPSAPAAPEAVTEVPPEPVRLHRRAGGWNLNDLERIVAEQQVAPPERVEEWRAYVFFLRDHADIDGELPASFDSLVEDVFADLVRAG